MQKSNLYFGLLMFVLFLLSGYYMETYFKPAHIDNLVLRMEIRANHIYILFIALLNIISFKCEFTFINKASAYLEMTSRTLLILAGMIALYAFMYDHDGNLQHRSETLTAAICSLSAVAAFLINESLHLFSSKS